MDQTKAEVLRKLAHQSRLPSMMVDLDAFDRNVAQLAALGRPVRLATKSLRVPALIKRALKSHSCFQGLMTFSAEETLKLAEMGFDDFLIAYPTVQPTDVEAIRQTMGMGKKVRLVIDSPAHVKALQSLWNMDRSLSVVIEVDASLRLLGGGIHLGVRRSPVRTAAECAELARLIRNTHQLSFAGVMVYEAQVAGLTDRNPFKKFLNLPAHLVRWWSMLRIQKLRCSIADAFQSEGIKLELFNGGGTGSINWAKEEKWLTEITAGSALYSSHLFDYYSNVKFEPSAFFALQVVRTSDPGFVTCQGGGYIASGEPGWDRLPRPVSPRGLSLVTTEGCGEVQTPVYGVGTTSLSVGDAVLFRHAKAGEVMERFNEVALVQGGKVVERVATYRGLGMSNF